MRFPAHSEAERNRAWHWCVQLVSIRNVLRDCQPASENGKVDGRDSILADVGGTAVNQVSAWMRQRRTSCLRALHTTQSRSSLPHSWTSTAFLVSNLSVRSATDTTLKKD